MKNSRMDGFTLVELLVAMVMTTIVLTSVFYAWNYLSRHTITQSLKTAFNVEAQRVALEVVGELRQSPAVLDWDGHEVTFVHHRTSDTITYSFNGIELQKNNEPLTFTTRDMQCTDFSIDPSSPSFSEEESTMLTITFSFTHKFDAPVTFVLNARIRRPLDIDQ